MKSALPKIGFSKKKFWKKISILIKLTFLKKNFGKIFVFFKNRLS